MDLDGGEWRYTVTKTNTPHIVPLSSQAAAILRELKPFTGRGRYVFSSARSSQRPMSDNAILAAMRRMGIAKDEMSGHGFRAMARTILDEVLSFRPDFIEHQLAHAVRDPNGRAYNRTAHLAERRKMMQAWADYLDKLKHGAEISVCAPPATATGFNAGRQPSAPHSQPSRPLDSLMRCGNQHSSDAKSLIDL